MKEKLGYERVLENLISSQNIIIINGKMIADTAAAAAIWLSAFSLPHHPSWIIASKPIVTMMTIMIKIKSAAEEKDDENYKNHHDTQDWHLHCCHHNLIWFIQLFLSDHHPSQDACVQKVVCWKRAELVFANCRFSIQSPGHRSIVPRMITEVILKHWKS